MRVVFAVNGLGMGNATRCHAVWSALKKAEPGADVRFVCLGRAADYLESHFPGKVAERLDAGSYAGGDRVSVAGSLTPDNLRRMFLAPGAALARTASGWGADVVVTDSFYATGKTRRGGTPVVALNNSDVSSDFGMHARAGTWRGNEAHLMLEKADRLVHRLTCDKAGSPWFDRGVPAGRGFVRTGLYARPGLEGGAGRGGSVLVMLSGSGLGRVDMSEGKTARAARAAGGRLGLMGDGARPGEGDPSVETLGRMLDNRETLRGCRAAVVNAGFSALSELACMRIPMLVVPVWGHAEQALNAATVRAMGWGEVTNATDWADDLAELLQREDSYREAYERNKPPRGGEDELALMVAEAARGKLGHA